MSETPLQATIDAFDEARGDALDGVWARSVSWTLLMRDVEADLVRDGLAEALEVVRQTRESPQELFGPACDHADALYGQWLSEGRLVLTADETTWRQAVLTGLVMSAVVAVGLLVLLALRGEATTALLPRLSAIAIVVGLGSALGSAVWQRRHRPRDLPIDAPTDVRWSLELTEVLRTRYAMSGPRVRDIVAEAGAHALESGASVEAEFGTPEEYAARFAPDLARRSRLTAAFLGSLALLNVVLLLDGLHWSNVGLLLGFGLLAVLEHRKARGLRSP